MLRFADGTAEQLLEPAGPAWSNRGRWITSMPVGPMRMQVEFYDHGPAGA